MSAKSSSPRQRNVKPVLSLGETRYLAVRHLGTFAIAPVPFKLGQLVMTLYTDMLIAEHAHTTTGTVQTQKQYFNLLSRLASALHRHMRPIGRIKSALWRVGLARNRFTQCSEQELKDVASFFLQGRMRSSVRLISELETQQEA